MRAIWKGSISFGLVNVPIKLFSATESHDVELHQVHNADGGRIRYQRRCEVCGKVVDYQDIAKAFDDGDRTVVLTEEDFDALPVEKSREISVLEFVPSDQLDPIMFQKTYYLAPDSKSTKSYVLLRRTLEETDRTAIVNFTLREKTRLGALRVRGDVLVLQSLLWEDEVREANFPELEENVRLSSKEMEMASALVSSFEADFNPDEFTDEYQVELRQLIQAKLEQGEALDTEKTFGEAGEEEGAEVLDLMEALRRSVEESRGKKAGAKGRRTGTDDEATPEAAAAEEPEAPAEDAEEKKPARKTAARKAPARQSAARKTPAGETTARKAPARKTPAKRASAEPAQEEPAAKKTTSRAKKAPAKKTA
jgi:DNA end-binding protein Ku